MKGCREAIVTVLQRKPVSYYKGSRRSFRAPLEAASNSAEAEAEATVEVVKKKVRESSSS